jgi:hypothetical protein
MRFFVENAFLHQLRQTIGQDVAGNAFIRRDKFPEGFLASKDNIPNDQQGPCVAEHVEREGNRTIGTPFLAVTPSKSFFQHP